MHALWFTVTNLPRIADGLSSEMYIGTVDEKMPMERPVTRRPVASIGKPVEKYEMNVEPM